MTNKRTVLDHIDYWETFCIRNCKVSSKRKGKSFLDYVEESDSEIWSKAKYEILKRDQYECFPDIFEFLNYPSDKKRAMPHLVKQLNVFKDGNGILRVKSKFSHVGKKFEDFPILIDRKSKLFGALVNEIHLKLNHLVFEPLTPIGFLDLLTKPL